MLLRETSSTAAALWINALSCISIVSLGGFGRHHYALESVHEIDRIYQSNNNLFLRLSTSPPLAALTNGKWIS